MKGKVNKADALKMFSESVKSNSITNNFLLIIYFVSFIIIGVDLVSDLAVEKNEIGTFIGILEETDSDVLLYCECLSEIERPLLFNISISDLLPADYISKSSVKDRGPPAV